MLAISSLGMAWWVPLSKLDLFRFQQDLTQTCRKSEYVGFVDFKYGADAQNGFLDISQILCTWGLGHSRWTYPIVVMAHSVSAGICCVYSVPTRTSALTTSPSATFPQTSLNQLYLFTGMC